MLEKLRELSALFLEVEADVKRIEIDTDKALIPALNELRYYANHISRAVSDPKGTSAVDEEFVRASRHLARARYDAFEHGSIELFLKIDDFRDRFPRAGKILTDTVPDYVAIVGEVEELKESSERNRRTIGEERPGSEAGRMLLAPSEVLLTRDENISEVTKDCFQTLRRIKLKLEAAEPLITERVAQENRDAQAKARRFVITVILSLAALIFAVVQALPTIKEIIYGGAAPQITAPPTL